jgi:hypothetical protein
MVLYLSRIILLGLAHNGRWPGVVASLLVVFVFSAPESMAKTTVVPSGRDHCAASAAQAEKRHGIPAYLLRAIALAESGRFDKVTAEMRAWPWTVMAERKGRYYDSKRQAITAVRKLQARGVSNIDVGCMQINLRHHPEAFSSLNEAFDPVSNTEYAAEFLTGLRTETGSWDRAAGRYHSATPKFNRPYREKIRRLWASARQHGATIYEAKKTTAEKPRVNRSTRARSPIDSQRVAMLNSRHRDGVRQERDQESPSSLLDARSRLPLVAMPRTRTGRGRPTVFRGGRTHRSASAVNPTRFEAKRKQQLSAWRASRPAPSQGIAIIRGDNKP